MKELTRDTIVNTKWRINNIQEFILFNRKLISYDMPMHLLFKLSKEDKYPKFLLVGLNNVVDSQSEEFFLKETHKEMKFEDYFEESKLNIKSDITIDEAKNISEEDWKKVFEIIKPSLEIYGNLFELILEDFEKSIKDAAKLNIDKMLEVIKGLPQPEAINKTLKEVFTISPEYDKLDKEKKKDVLLTLKDWVEGELKKC